MGINQLLSTIGPSSGPGVYELPGLIDPQQMDGPEAKSRNTPCMRYLPTLGWFGASMGRHIWQSYGVFGLNSSEAL